MILITLKEYNRHFYVLILTLTNSGKKVLIFLLSTAPIFIGFAFSGTVMFSKYSDRFQSFDKTAISLFALVCGDDVHATFNDLLAVYPFPFVAQIYLYAFTTLFITAILNVFIFIIEDSYHFSKYVDKQKQEDEKKLTIENILEIIEQEPDSLLINEDTELSQRLANQTRQANQNPKDFFVDSGADSDEEEDYSNDTNPVSRELKTMTKHFMVKMEAEIIQQNKMIMQKYMKKINRSFKKIVTGKKGNSSNIVDI